MRVTTIFRSAAFCALLVMLSAVGVAANKSKPLKNEQIRSLISNYKSWKQVNRFDDDVTAASFKIENPISFGGG